jgi:hypothetical protein
MKSYSSRPFWFYRIYCLVIVSFWNITAISSIVTRTKPRQELFYFFPLLIPAIFLILSLSVFKFPYSAFGKLKRTQPSGNVVDRDLSYSGEIGCFQARGPFISWVLYNDGIGFSAIGVGSGFVPFSVVSNIERHRFGGCTVVHSSPEVRSPLVISSSRFADAIVRLYWSLKQ